MKEGRKESRNEHKENEMPVVLVGENQYYFARRTMITEADTCRKYVLPKLIQAGWDNDPHSFTETESFIDGRFRISAPNGTLFGDGVCARIKEELLKDYHLHTIVRLPNVRRIHLSFHWTSTSAGRDQSDVKIGRDSL